ncbi:AAA family ATPase [Alteromonas sp. H39]|uniref:AAA family ATPase n=1 Tax=Alteromonas sp. H39 TaxID=3389876 RepID=UPI0039E1D1EB
MHNLFIFAGQPGVGKSTWSARLARACGGCFIDIDAHFSHVVEAGLNLADHDQNDRDSDIFKQTFRDPIYLSMFALARDNLTHSDVVMNGPFTRELSQPDWTTQLARTYSASVHVIYLTCDATELRERIQKRGLSRDIGKLANWDHYQQRFRQSGEPLCKHTRVDTGIVSQEEWITMYLERCGIERKNGG